MELILAYNYIVYKCANIDLWRLVFAIGHFGQSKIDGSDSLRHSRLTGDRLTAMTLANLYNLFVV